MNTALEILYGLFCAAGIAVDAYSLVCYLLRTRRPGPPPIPLAGLMLYVLAGMLRVFMRLDPLVVRWELLVLVAFHIFVHAIVPLATRARPREAPGK